MNKIIQFISVNQVFFSNLRIKKNILFSLVIDQIGISPHFQIQVPGRFH